MSGSVAGGSSAGGSGRFRTQQAELHLVLYTIFGKHAWSNVGGAIAGIVNILQLLTFAFEPAMPWGITGDSSGQPLLVYFAWLRSIHYVIFSSTVIAFVIFAFVLLGVLMWSCLLYAYRFSRVRATPWCNNILRYGSRLLLDGLWMNALSTLLLPFRCINNIWTFYPDRVCNTALHSALLGMGVLGILLLIPFLVLVASVQVDWTLGNHRLSGQRDGRYTIISMAIKTLLIGTYTLNDYRVAKVLFSALAMGFLMYYTLVDMPFYSHIMLRGMMVGMLNAMIAMLVALDMVARGSVVNNQNGAADGGGLISLIITFVLWIPGTFLGDYIMRRRLRSLKKRTDLLQQAIANWREVEQGLDSSLPSRPDRDLEVAVWQPYAFVTPSEVAPCVLLYVFSADDTERKKAGDVLAVATKQFPRHAGIMNLYANWLLNVAGNATLALVTARKASKSAAMWDVLFQARCISYDTIQRLPVELGGNGGMDVMSFVSYHNNLAEAIRLHRIAMHRSQEFWKVLNSENPDASTIANLVWDITQSETRAEDLYTKLVKKYPTARPLLQNYSKFLLHLKHDDRAAAEIMSKVEKLEPARGLIDDDGASTDGGSPIMINKPLRTRKDMQNIATPRSSRTDEAHEKREKYIDDKGQAEVRVGKHRLASQVLRIGWVLTIAAIIILSTAHTWFIFTEESFKIALNGTDVASQRCEKLTRPLLFAHQLQDHATANETAGYAATQQAMLAFVADFRQFMGNVRARDFQTSLFRGGGPAVDAEWTKVYVSITLTTSNQGAPVVTLQKQMTFWDATNSLIDAAAGVAALPMATLANAPLLATDPGMRYLVDNTFSELTTDCQTLPQTMITAISSSLNIESLVQIILVCVTLGLIVFAFMVVRNVVGRAHAEHVSAVHLFFELPRSAVSSIYARIVATNTETNGFNSDSSSGGSSSYGSSYTSSTDSLASDASVVGAKSQSLVRRLTYARWFVLVGFLSFLLLFILSGVLLVDGQLLVVNGVQDVRTIAGNVREMQLLLWQKAQATNLTRHFTIDEIDARLTALHDGTEAVLYNLRLGPRGVDPTPYFPPEVYGGDCEVTDGCVPLTQLPHARVGLFSIVEFLLERVRQRIAAPSFPPQGDVLNDELDAMIEGALLPYVNLVVERLRNSVIDGCNVTEIAMSFIFFMNLLYIAGVKTLFFPTVAKYLREEVAKTAAMLYMVPADVIAQVDEIRWYLHDVQKGLQRFRNSERKAVCVVGVNAKGEIVRSFRGLTETLGYRANALDGESVHTLFPDLFNARDDSKKKPKKFVDGLKELLETKSIRSVYDSEHATKTFRVGAVDCREDYGDDIPFKICLYPVTTSALMNRNESVQPAHEFSSVIMKGVLDYSTEGFLVIDESASISFASAGAVRMFNCADIDELREQPLMRLLPGHGDAEGLLASIETQAGQGPETRSTREINIKGGKKLAVETRVASLADVGAGQPYLLMLSPLSAASDAANETPKPTNAFGMEFSLPGTNDDRDDERDDETSPELSKTQLSD